MNGIEIIYSLCWWRYDNPCLVKLTTRKRDMVVIVMCNDVCICISPFDTRDHLCLCKANTWLQIYDGNWPTRWRMFMYGGNRCTNMICRVHACKLLCYHACIFYRKNNVIYERLTITFCTRELDKSVCIGIQHILYTADHPYNWFVVVFAIGLCFSDCNSDTTIRLLPVTVPWKDVSNLTVITSRE
jgi:hypothetical protein